MRRWQRSCVLVNGGHCVGDCVLLRRLFNNVVWFNYTVILDYIHTYISYSLGQRHVICLVNNFRYMKSERIEFSENGTCSITVYNLSMHFLV